MSKIRFDQSEDNDFPEGTQSNVFVDAADGIIKHRKPDGSILSLEAGAASVSSVFGRVGDVVAATSDYDASQVDNDSTVIGSTVKDALDLLGASSHAAITLNSSVPTQETITLSGQEIEINLATVTNDGAMSGVDKSKLDGIELLAEVNNISDANAVDLTDSGESSLHFHAADRIRSNHTGTQTASTISDFDTEVSNNATVVLNTAKVSADGLVTTHSDVTSAGSGAIITNAERTKLSGIEALAEVNNISDINAIDLTDGGDSALHFHSNDRARANHTGTQLAATISDLESTISANTSVVANTAKVTNATHTGDVAGSGALTIQPEAITGQSLVVPQLGDTLLIADLSGGNILNKILVNDLIGDVVKVGTPVDNQLAVWTGDGTIEGTTGLTYDGSELGVVGKGIFSDNIVTGEGSGSVALTINDGVGNASVTYNHEDGVPDKSGNFGRAKVNVDSTTNAEMVFQLGENGVAGVGISATDILRLFLESGVISVDVQGALNVVDGIVAGDTVEVTKATGLMALLGDSGNTDKYAQFRDSASGGNVGYDSSENNVGIQCGTSKGFAVKVNSDATTFGIASPDLEIDTTGNATFGGTVNTRDIAADGAKIDAMGMFRRSTSGSTAISGTHIIVFANNDHNDGIVTFGGGNTEATLPDGVHSLVSRMSYHKSTVLFGADGAIDATFQSNTNSAGWVDATNVKLRIVIGNFERRVMSIIDDVVQVTGGDDVKYRVEVVEVSGGSHWIETNSSLQITSKA